jgi:hypothetical protein
MEMSGQFHAPAALHPGKRAPGTHWIGDWVGPRAVLDAVVKRKISSPRWETNPRTPIVQPVAQRYTDWAITVHWTAFVANKVSLNKSHESVSRLTNQPENWI